MVYICKTKLWDTFALTNFLIWCIENKLLKENVIYKQFLNLYKSHNFDARTLFFYCIQNLLLYKFYGIHLAILVLLVFVQFCLKFHIYFQRSTYISHNILEWQNSIHYICRVRDSERNKTNPISLASKLWELQAIPFGKKKFPVEANYQRKYKQPPVSLCVCVERVWATSMHQITLKFDVNAPYTVLFHIRTKKNVKKKYFSPRESP